MEFDAALDSSECPQLSRLQNFAMTESSSKTSIHERSQELCERFQRAWEKTSRPYIEDYLPPPSAPGYSWILCELLRAEVACRRERGEQPKPQDYLYRFAQELEIVERAFLPAAPSKKMVWPQAPEDRYRLGEEIARGGMGAVFRGEDRYLQREVALKIVLPEKARKGGVMRRLLEEAQVGAQLQHPGVAPVYDLGKLPDGSPFFAMKLVRGRTLNSILRDRQTLQEKRLRHLRIFEQVCLTVAYAHSQGVVHRDLKPDNVMVGAFGEVQVMDWGVAKVLGVKNPSAAPRPDSVAIAETEIETIRPQEEYETTRAGSVLGTPAYMPPEQALGDVDKVGPTADVFALGATLCEILVGKPPYDDPDPLKTLEMARFSELKRTFQRLDQCGADSEVVQIARDCLQSDPKKRPQHANAVAERLSGYLQSAERKSGGLEMSPLQWAIVGAASVAGLALGLVLSRS